MVKVYLYPTSISFRFGIKALSNLIENEGLDINDSLFVFFSKDKKAIKILKYDDSGIWLYQKRLSGYRFIIPSIDNRLLVNKEYLNNLLSNLKAKRLTLK